MNVDIDHAEVMILRHWCCLPDETRELGAAWYPAARALAAAMQPTDPERACGVVAALSPRTQWAQNLLWASQILEHARLGSHTAPAVHTTRQRAVAWHIATGGAPLEHLSGPKVRSFYRNMIGNTRAVTVDVWAARVAGHGHLKTIRPNEYAALVVAYRRAAKTAGTDPSTLQAATWIAARGSHE